MNRARNNGGMQQNTNQNGMGNGTNGINGNRTNGINGNGMNNGMRDELLEKIRELSLVKVELELYLDTHPDCRTALDYYYQTVEALKRLTEEYNNTKGPLVAQDANDTRHWTWTDTPWPWHNGEITAVPNCREERR